MARPKIEREATATPGGRKVTRAYLDGPKVIKYEVRIKDGTGILVSEGTYDDYKVARSVLTDAKARVQTGIHVRKGAGTVRFENVAATWLASAKVAGLKQRTRAAHNDTVNGRLKPLHQVPVGRLGYREVSRFAASLADDKLAPASQRRILWVLRAVMQEAVDQGYVALNPCDKLPKIKGQKAKLVIPNPSQVERLIALLAQDRVTKERAIANAERAAALPRWDLLVEFAAYTGLRAGEIAGLRVKNVDTEARKVTVEETVVDVNGHLRIDTPKSAAGWREVADLDPGLCSRLAAHLAGLRACDYVFGSRDETGNPRPYCHRRFSAKVFRPACERAAMVGVRFHDLRHFHASLLIDEGLTATEVAQRLGHDDAGFTLRTYVHLFKKDEDSRLGTRIAARRLAARQVARSLTLVRGVGA